jgi:hypothetical protein
MYFDAVNSVKNMLGALGFWCAVVQRFLKQMHQVGGARIFA